MGNCIYACNKETIQKLSPFQRQIIEALENGPLNLDQLSKITGKSVYSVGKQLSILQLRTCYNPLKKKGITAPLIVKVKDEHVKTTYLIKPAQRQTV